MFGFFVLAYAISWTSFYALGRPVVFTLGPFLAALIMAAVADGRAGLLDVASRILSSTPTRGAIVIA